MKLGKWTKRALVAAGGAAVAVASGFQLSRWYFEEPSYRALESEGAFEVRRYAPRVVAETRVVASDRRAATSVGFSRLADYIFGGNERISMTTPVESTPSSGERIAMTTPVETAPSDGRWTVVFTMPSEYSLEDLPAPRDDRVTLRRDEGRTVAALRFAGRMREDVRQQKEAELLARVEAAGYRPTSEVTTAIYDPPAVVLSPFRRNEVLVEVERP